MPIYHRSHWTMTHNDIHANDAIKPENQTLGNLYGSSDMAIDTCETCLFIKHRGTML